MAIQDGCHGNRHCHQNRSSNKSHVLIYDLPAERRGIRYCSRGLSNGPVYFVNQKGNVLVLTMFLLLMLTIIGISALHTSSVEMQISGNNKKLVQEFYASEGALISVLENSGLWLDDHFINSGETFANWSEEVDFDNDGHKDALVEVRCVEPTGVNIETLSPAANDFPTDHHIAPPPVDSGFSIRHFIIRKYAITASALKTGTTLQVGVWKAFNKSGFR